MIKEILKYCLWFILLILFQILLFNNIRISGYINPYIYILFILLLPFNTNKIILLFSSFFLGFVIDSFMFTYGLHTSASLFLAFCRPQILKIIAPREGYEKGTSPRMIYHGTTWFLKYVLISVFIHHLVLFYLESFRIENFFLTFARVIISTLVTSLIIFISQYFISRK